MKKVLLLTILVLLTGCGVETVQEDKAKETSYYLQSSILFDIVVDKETCVEYILFEGGYKGGITTRLNSDNTLKLNEICLKSKGD